MSGIPLKMMRPIGGTPQGKGGDYRAEGTKLLEGLSSDSEQEQFSLPPLDLRGPSTRSKRFKERLPSPPASVDGCCSTKMAVCVFVLLVLSVVVSGLAVYTYSLSKDLQTIKSKMNTVESGSASNPGEFRKVNKELDELKNSLKEATEGPQGLEAQQKNISLIIHQLQLLNQTTKTLSQSLDNAPHLKLLPERVTELSEHVAEFGSRMTTVEQDVDELKTFKTSTETHITTLEELIKSLENEAPTEGPLDEKTNIPPEYLEQMQKLIDTLNTTATTKYLEIKAQITSLTRDLQRLNSSMTTLGDGIAYLQTSASETSSQIDELKQTASTKEELQILQNQVQNVSLGLREISDQHDGLGVSLGAVTSADLEELRGEMNQCCTRCADSLKVFNSSLDALKIEISTLKENPEDFSMGASTGLNGNEREYSYKDNNYEKNYSIGETDEDYEGVDVNTFESNNQLSTTTIVYGVQERTTTDIVSNIDDSANTFSNSGWAPYNGDISEEYPVDNDDITGLHLKEDLPEDTDYLERGTDYSSQERNREFSSNEDNEETKELNDVLQSLLHELV